MNDRTANAAFWIREVSYRLVRFQFKKAWYALRAAHLVLLFALASCGLQERLTLSKVEAAACLELHGFTKIIVGDVYAESARYFVAEQEHALGPVRDVTGIVRGGGSCTIRVLYPERQAP